MTLPPTPMYEHSSPVVDTMVSVDKMLTNFEETSFEQVMKERNRVSVIKGIKAICVVCIYRNTHVLPLLSD